MNAVLAFVKKNAVVCIIAALISIGAAGYLAGFRIEPGPSLARVGTITLVDLPKGASVYTDGASRGTASATSSPMQVDLTPGNHMVIVGATGYFPWSKMVTVVSGKDTAVAPIFVRMNVAATPITGSEATSTLAATAATTLPASSTPLSLEKGCVNVYVENNQVVASASNAAGCTPPAYLCSNGSCAPTVVFAPRAQLLTVLPYPGHQDALIVGINNILYAIALDPRNPQFFAPILEGSNPPSAALVNDALVVREGNKVFKVGL